MQAPPSLLWSTDTDALYMGATGISYVQISAGSLQGATGQTGMGMQGQTGIEGMQGQTGIALGTPPVYGGFYSTRENYFTVNVTYGQEWNKVIPDLPDPSADMTAMPSSGIDVSPSTCDMTVTVPGTYRIGYSICATNNQDVMNCDSMLFVDGWEHSPDVNPDNHPYIYGGDIRQTYASAAMLVPNWGGFNNAWSSETFLDMTAGSVIDLRIMRRGGNGGYYMIIWAASVFAQLVKQ